MNREDIANASDRLENVDDKLECIINTVAFIDMDSFSFSDKSMAGFYTILRDLQKDIKKVKKLLN